MSADAKIWEDDNWWYGLHDGPCVGDMTQSRHKDGDYHLSTVLDDIEACIGKLRWVVKGYPSAQVGLSGYHS